MLSSHAEGVEQLQGRKPYRQRLVGGLDTLE